MRTELHPLGLQHYLASELAAQRSGTAELYKTFSEQAANVRQDFCASVYVIAVHLHGVKKATVATWNKR